MTDRNIVRMVNLIAERAARSAADGGCSSVQASVDGTYLAKVVSVQPFAIMMQGVTVSSNIFINPALTFNASNISDYFQTPFEPESTCQFLKEFHEKYAVKAGDTVIVLVSGSNFYIAGRAVAAG